MFLDQEEFEISYDELLKIIPNKYKLSIIMAKRLQQLLDERVRNDKGAKIDRKKLIYQIYEELKNNKLVIEEI